MVSINELIGFDYVKNLERPCTSYGVKYYNNLEKFSSVDKIKAEHELLQKCFKLDNINELRSLLKGIKDIALTLKSIKAKQSVSVVELYEIKFQALHTRRIKKQLSDSVICLHDVDKIIKILDPSGAEDYSFNVYDCFDEELSNILKEKRKIEININTTSNEEKSRWIVKRDEVIIRELNRVEEVIMIIVRQLSVEIDAMIGNVDLLCKLDILLTKVLIQRRFKYCVPDFNDKIILEGALLPIVSENVEEFVNLSMELERGSTLISGANMGGKSTALKNIAFQYALLMHGFLPMCDYFSGPFIDKIVYMQQIDSTEHGLSRFGNEIRFVSDALQSVDEKTIFIVDEFASSTNPNEGKIFMESLIELCNEKPMFSIFTTHFGNLGHLCNFYKVRGLKHELLDKDIPISKLMDYSIEKSDNYDVDMQALNVASHLKIDEEFLNVLKNNYDRRK